MPSPILMSIPVWMLLLLTVFQPSMQPCTHIHLYQHNHANMHACACVLMFTVEHAHMRKHDCIHAHAYVCTCAPMSMSTCCSDKLTCIPTPTHMHAHPHMHEHACLRILPQHILVSLLTSRRETWVHAGSPTSPGLRIDKLAFTPMPAPVQRVFYLSADGGRGQHEVWPEVNPRVLDTIDAADAVIYGIGSLFTSICPSVVLQVGCTDPSILTQLVLTSSSYGDIVQVLERRFTVAIMPHPFVTWSTWHVRWDGSTPYPG